MPQSAGVATRSGRAQSETIGLVLVFGLVILGASAVVVLGASAIGDSEDRLSTQRAEKSLTQLDSKAALVALGNTDVQSVSFSRREDGRFTVTPGTGWMNVTIQNTSSGATTDLVNQSLGAVTYDNGGDRIAYQGGGVWRSSGNGSFMVSPPEFHFRNGTLTLPIINVTGGPSLNGGAALRHAQTIDKYPNGTDRENPLDEHRIFVVVQSDYYAAWGSYFEERTDGNVKYDHVEKKAILELVSPLGKQTLDAASSSRAASGSFELHGSAQVFCGEKVYSNSYNSTGTTNDYCDQTPRDQGHIIYGENVDIDAGSGDSDLHGNVVSGGNVTVTASGGGGQPNVTGHINYTDYCKPSVSDCQDRIQAAGATVNKINGIDTMHNINLLISTKVDDVKNGDNDNGPAPISGGTLDFGGSTDITLTNGTYYLENIDLDDDETLILDTSSGDVTLAVEGGIRLRGSGSGGGTIKVQGDGSGKIYLLGEDTLYSWSDDLQMEENSGILTPNDNATQFKLYGPDDLLVSVGDGNNLAKFVGVLFSPPGRSGTGRVDIYGGEVYGGILTGTTTIDKGSIHYDEALRNTQVISRDSKVVRVTYLHVTVNQIKVSNG